MLEDNEDRYYLRLKHETVRISRAVFDELLLKATQSFDVEESDGYFWASYTLNPRE